MDSVSWISVTSFSVAIFSSSVGVLTLPFLVISEVMPEKVSIVETPTFWKKIPVLYVQIALLQDSWGWHLFMRSASIGLVFFIAFEFSHFNRHIRNAWNFTFLCWMFICWSCIYHPFSARNKRKELWRDNGLAEIGNQRKLECERYNLYYTNLYIQLYNLIYTRIKIHFNPKLNYLLIT